MDGEEGDVCSGGSVEICDYCIDEHWDVCTSLYGNLYSCEVVMAKEGDNFDVDIEGLDEGKSWAVVVDGYCSTLMEIRGNYYCCDIHCR